MNAHPRDIHGSPTLPDAIEAEQALLGALLMRNDCIDDIPSSFEPNHFEEQIHRLMFEGMIELRTAGKTFSPITLKGMLPNQPIGGISIAQYMSRLMGEAVGYFGVKDWCRAITAAAARRELYGLADDLRQISLEEELRIPDDVDALRQRLAEVTRSLAGEEATFSLADAIDNSFEAVNDASRGRKAEGVDPGIPEVMQLTGPWQKGQLIIIGGGVKQGKTALAMQCMFEIAKSAPVFLYSGEMTVKQIIMREQARRTGISARQQQRGRVSDQEVQMLLEAGVEIKRSQHIEIDTRKMTLDQIGRKARALKKSHNIGAVFVDHIGKIQWEGKMQYEEEFKQGQIATSKLKDLAMELDLPVVALTHLKKSAFQEYQGSSLEKRLHAVLHRRPTYRDLIGNMDKDADQVIIPFQPRPILAGMEPGEGTPDWNVWKSLMDQTEGKAEILLSLSRESEFPRRRDIAWDGNSTSYGPSYKAQMNSRELF
ncbi:DnaB-like helicase C-terminal domain-containing protein [Rhizobium sp. BK251]|uniref:DnaB-like helicase C-terminal domain-containing protein n=1 Tax=Rhizobium sp. BK251 TaxID=2512125 RepID=UPI001049D788|nr:DnaB-like helicase C-terminal domain-containing protein [Rhizobium sp. BK251]TCL70626.1 replicative DNA helicase [Rhizobium sp. BK251]